MNGKIIQTQDNETQGNQNTLNVKINSYKVDLNEHQQDIEKKKEQYDTWKTQNPIIKQITENVNKWVEYQYFGTQVITKKEINLMKENYEKDKERITKEEINSMKKNDEKDLNSNDSTILYQIKILEKSTNELLSQDNEYLWIQKSLTAAKNQIEESKKTISELKELKNPSKVEIELSMTTNHKKIILDSFFPSSIFNMFKK